MAALVMEPPQPPAPRLSATCDRHPDESFTGFCTSCLRERLQGLEATSTTHRNSTSTISSSLKSIFFKPANPPSSSSSSAPHQPELRRCRSFSFSGPRLSASFEPQRKSCDVRGRNTLWALFNQGGGGGGGGVGIGAHCASSSSSSYAFAAPAAAAAGAGEIEIVEDAVATVEDSFVTAQASGEIDVEERPMKDHIDLESQSKKPPAKDLAGSFWLAASVFSKKLQKWRRKQKLKKMKKHEGSRKNGADSSRRFRETQSEIAVDAFGRRSCDLGPRFSLDAGRISFEDPRYSFDEPRASWDGYLIGGGGGGRSALSRPPPMLSVVEDAPSPVVQRTDGEIPVEEDLGPPGGSAQTKDYYSDSSSRSRRRSLDRSSSVKRPSVEMSETTMPVPAAKVPLDAGADLFRDWSSSSLRDDYSESFGSAFREAPAQKAPPRKKSRRWSKAWSIWGFIHRRSTSGKGNGSVVDRSFSETWPELQANGCHASGRFVRSNSSASSRGSIYGNAGVGSARRISGLETNGIGKKRRDEFVLERNRSARYSPGNADSNGMLRFYLTPMRGSRRGMGKSKPNNSYHSFARSVLQLY